MSHDATNWAIKQRGIKPALKVVLWHLCDRYNPDMGCFPSQETLAEDCEVPRSTLNVYLGELERVGLIAREKRRSKGTKQQERTRYYFPFEAVFEEKRAEIPCPETGHGPADPVSRNAGEPSPENGESRVQNLDSNPVREPVNVTGNEREGVREADFEKVDQSGTEHADSPASIERSFKRWFLAWPTAVDDSEPEARKAWGRLTAAERRDVAALTPLYLAERARIGRSPKMTCAAGVYLKEKRWERLAKTQPGSDAPKPAAPFGKAWSAKRFAHLDAPSAPLPKMTPFLQGLAMDEQRGPAIRREHAQRYGWPAVTEMHGEAERRTGTIVTADIAALGEAFVAVRVGGPVWDAWIRVHERRNWPFLPDPGKLEFVHFPPLPEHGPVDLDDAVEAAIEDFAAKLKEVRGDEHAA